MRSWGIRYLGDVRSIRKLILAFCEWLCYAGGLERVECWGSEWDFEAEWESELMLGVENF